MQVTQRHIFCTVKFVHILQWLHAPISSYEVLSDVVKPSDASKPRPKKSNKMRILIFFDFVERGILYVSQNMPIRTEEIERVFRRVVRVVRRVGFPRPRNSDNIPKQEITAKCG